MSEPKLLPFDEAVALYVKALMETRRRFGLDAIEPTPSPPTERDE